MVASEIAVDVAPKVLVVEESKEQRETESGLLKPLSKMALSAEPENASEPAAHPHAEMKAEIKKRFTEDELKLASFRGESIDEMLQRYLQARKFDISKAEPFLRESLRWRREFAAKCVADGREGCLGCEVDEIIQFYPGAYAASPDKLGRPIWYEKTGSLDSYALSTLTTNNDFVRYHVCLMEGLQDQYVRNSKITGKYVNKTCTILDLEGFTLSMLTGEAKQMIQLITQTDSSYYPETMGSMYLINAPGVFSMAWSIIQGFLDPRTVGKISVLGGESEWKPKLIEVIGEENLPQELGGKGPSCLPEKKRFTEKSIASSGVEKVEKVVKQGDIVKYKFFTRNNGNISFNCLFKMSDEKVMEVIPMKDYPVGECSNGNFVAGEFEAPSEGTFVACWEHPGWWTRQLLYSVTVSKP